MTKITLPLIMLIGVLLILASLISAEDDPTGYLKALQCHAELALKEKDYTEAKRLADIVVSKAFDGPRNWRRGNLLHNGYRILGMVAMQKGDIENAKAHLLNAAVTHSGSPQLVSFGPNMLLAKLLLEHGEKEVVLEYLTLCKRFWDRDELAKWTAEIENGKTPDFGANLIYGIDLPGSPTCPKDIDPK